MSSVSAESTSAAILAHLSRIGVDFRKRVGQGYNGWGCSKKTDFRNFNLIAAQPVHLT